MLKKNLKNLSYQSIAQVIPRAMMFIFILYLARILGSTEFGKFEFAMSLGYLIGMFFELGGNMILTKHIARNYYSSINFAVKIRVTSILFTLTILYSLLFFFNIYEESRLYIIYASLGLAFSSMMNLYFAFFRGALKMSFEAIVLIIQKILFIVIAFSLTYNDRSGSQALLAFMISMLVGLLIIFFIFKREESKYLKYDKKQEISFNAYAKDVFTLAMVEVFSNVYYRLNQILIEHYNGFEEVSLYGVSYRIVEALISFPSILLIVLFPSFAKLAVENIIEFKENFLKILRLLFVSGIIAGGGCFIFGEAVISLLGNEYEAAYRVLQFLIISIIFLFPNFLITQSLIALNKNVIFAKILLLALIVNVILSLLLVPKLGAIGSAISIGICELLICIIGFYYIMKFTNERAQK